MALLEVEGLSMGYVVRGRALAAVRDLTFTLDANRTLGLVGESGCGKSSVGFTLMGLLADNGRILGGQVRFDGQDLMALDEAGLRAVRWRGMAMVFQSAMNALNPVIKVGRQVEEAMLAHGTVGDGAAARSRAAELFALVGLPADRLDSYPHELSGGMRQRAVIAMSLACRPRLLIADEPTTALDVVVQDQVFRRIAALRREFGLAMILISHDIGAVAENCEQVAVMYGGRIVEHGPTEAVMTAPRHPYSALLLAATPRVFGPAAELVSLPGTPPPLGAETAGCVFSHRCPAASELCRSQAPALRQDAGHGALCHYAGEIAPADLVARVPTFARSAPARTAAPFVALHKVEKAFAVSSGVFGALLGRDRALRAVNGIELAIGRGEALGLVGESGCGKTTTGMMLARLEDPTGGRIVVDGTDVASLSGEALRAFRRRVQVIFQDPYESLNPRMTVGEALAEPLAIHAPDLSAAGRRARVAAMLERVGLSPAEQVMARLPSRLSGGQRQRVAIARAMIVEPQLVIADEPVSMLDASVKAGIMALLKSFKDAGVTFLIITHDLSIARYLCERIAVMYLGDIVEHGPAEALIAAPRHPYTRALLSAVPEFESGQRRPRFAIEGEPPNPLDRPAGCAFHPRCPEARAACRTWRSERYDLGGRDAACIAFAPGSAAMPR